MRVLSVSEAGQVVRSVCNTDELDEPVIEYLIGLLTSLSDDALDEELVEVASAFAEWSNTNITADKLRQALELMPAQAVSLSADFTVKLPSTPKISSIKPTKILAEPAGSKQNRIWQPLPSFKVEYDRRSSLNFSTLSVHAKEFIPGGLYPEPYCNLEAIPNDLTDGTVSLSLEDISGEVHRQQSAEGITESNSELFFPWEYAGNIPTSCCSVAADDAQYTAAAVTLLIDQFPQYSEAQLSHLFVDEGYDLLRCFDFLYQVERDLAAQLADDSNGCEPGPSFTDEDFPVLATPSNGALLHQPSASALQNSFATALQTRVVDSVAVSSSTASRKTSQKQKAASKVASSVPWVETGHAVSSQYSESRALARDLARLRNMYFMQATQAFLAGNKALAKELSAKGRKYNEEMKAAHSVASSAIFQQRNDEHVARNFIDLHGLHVTEALDVLQQQMKLARTGQHQKLRICVGTGRHTKGPAARLPVAVEQYLQSQHTQFAYELPGLIAVKLRS